MVAKTQKTWNGLVPNVKQWFQPWFFYVVQDFVHISQPQFIHSTPDSHTRVDKYGVDMISPHFNTKLKSLSSSSGHSVLWVVGSLWVCCVFEGACLHGFLFGSPAGKTSLRRADP